MRKLELFLIVALLFVGCEKEYEVPEDQPVLFEYRYVNYAWGYSEHGWLVDAQGDVHRYDFPEEFRLPDSTGYIPVADLIHNLSRTDSIIHRVQSGDLEYYMGLIPGAAEGEISKSEHVAADAGNSVLSCYLFDPEKNMYQYVFLASSGDWVQTNESKEAEILVEHLKEVGGIFWLAI